MAYPWRQAAALSRDLLSEEAPSNHSGISARKRQRPQAVVKATTTQKEHLAMNLVGAYWAFRNTLNVDVNSTHDLPPKGAKAGKLAVEPHEVAMRGTT
jgi:hypothetical protein